MAWLVPLVLGVAFIAAVLGWFRDRRNPTGAVSWVANTAYLSRLPSYRSRMRLYRWALAGLAMCLLIAVIGTALLVARPVDREVRASAMANRDIMLCLDVSGSMLEFDAELVDKFSQMVQSFDGERIAMSIWNRTSRTVLPLTDDYDLVNNELTHAAHVLSTAALPHSLEITPELEEFVTGTLSLDQDASSLVGDGLASCALSFDAEGTDRSRSIILATDNQVIGEPIYSLQEAVDVTADRGIGLYGLFIASQDAYSADAEHAYEQAITSRGGAFYYADDPSAIDAIIDSITSEQAQTLNATPEVVITDRPEAVLWIAVIGVAGLIFIGWRLGT